MGRKNKNLDPLDSYANRFSKLMSKYESVTTHVMLAYLYSLNKIHPWNVVPQANTKRGIIDFFYMPKDERFNIIVEVKKFLWLDATKQTAGKKYLKGPFPSELKHRDRKEGIRLLILTDFKSVRVSMRNKEIKKTSRTYSLPIKRYDTCRSCSDEISRWFRSKPGSVCREILWDDKQNRYMVVFNYIKKNSEFSKRLYKRWLQETGMKGGRGRKKQFVAAFKAKIDLSHKHVDPNHLHALKAVFDDENIKIFVKDLFKDLGVEFQRGPIHSIFKEK